MVKQANKMGTNPLISSVVNQVIGQERDSASSNSKNSLTKALLARLKSLQGIKSVTYRFPVEEIAEFDQMILDIQKALGGKRVSKNDVVRTGVNSLLEDWQNNGRNGLIFKLLQERVKKLPSSN